MSTFNPASKRILIAEDVQTISTMITTALGDYGFQVDLATDGEQCLEKAFATKPALIILDINMPKIYGMEVLRRLRADARTHDTGIILSTAKNYRLELDQARELGVYDILLKPFKESALMNTVERFFTGKASFETAPAPIANGEVYRPQIPLDSCYYRMWGTRGSIPVSGPRYVRHGGNTPCVEVGFGEQYIIMDAGSGIRDLGYKLAKNGPGKVHLFITHTHWDHIQGFPFFAPAYIPGFEIVIYGASSFRKDLKSLFRGQLDWDYFPVQFEDMKANIEFHPLDERVVQIGGIQISWEFTVHPATSVAFKCKMNGKTMAYVSDNEFLFGNLGAPQTLNLKSEIVAPFRNLIDFAASVDVLIGEAQYTSEEYQSKIGWGHSSLPNACLLTKLARPKRWVVTHHDPLHEDDFLDNKLNLTREIMRSLDYPVEVIHAYDGLTEYF